MKDINEERGQIAEIVSTTVVETFSEMFGQPVTADSIAKRTKELTDQQSVFSSIKLHQGKNDVEFCFRFDFDLLLQAAALIFTPEYLAHNKVHEELAREIANIVCSKVKAYLNERGYDIDMGFPYIPQPEQNPLLQQTDVVHMHFYYNATEAEQGVGVVVNFFTDQPRA